MEISGGDNMKKTGKKSWDKYKVDSLLNVPSSIKNLPASGVGFNIPTGIKTAGSVRKTGKLVGNKLDKIAKGGY